MNDRIQYTNWLAEHYTPVYRHEKIKYWQSIQNPTARWKTTEEVVREWEDTCPASCPDKGVDKVRICNSANPSVSFPAHVQATGTIPQEISGGSPHGYGQ